MRPGYSVKMLIGLLVLATMVSGCLGLESSFDNGSGDSDSAEPAIKTDNAVTSMPVEKPPGLFNLNGLSWYEYNVTRREANTIESWLLKVEYSNETFTYEDGNGTRHSVPARHTKIGLISLNEDWKVYPDYYENTSDGSRLGGQISLRINGTPLGIGIPPDSLTGNSSWRMAGREYDISTMFDTVKDDGMKAEGFEMVRYDGDLYNCTIYVSAENPDFKVWHNTSIPLPLRIMADYKGYGDKSRLRTFELTCWG